MSTSEQRLKPKGDRHARKFALIAATIGAILWAAALLLGMPWLLAW